MAARIKKCENFQVDIFMICKRIQNSILQAFTVTAFVDWKIIQKNHSTVPGARGSRGHIEHVHCAAAAGPRHSGSRRN